MFLKHVSISSTPAGSGVTWYTLRNSSGMRVIISNRGAAMVSWWVADRYGHEDDVLLGYPDDAGYVENLPYFGAIVGRWGNRIAKGQFSLDGVVYQVDCNDGDNHLHGGHAGFHRKLWQVQPDPEGLRMTLAVPAGEAGFPGALLVSVLYRFNDDGALTIDYSATADAATPINLTSHAYFNLNGGVADIGDHLIAIDADRYLQVDAGLIPVRAADVAGSAFDFRQPAPIGARLSWPDPQLALAGGFDHCYCLRKQEQEHLSSALRQVAQVSDPGSGRQLTILTTEPGLQFYSGNFLAGVQGRGSEPYALHDGFCLEAQAFPDQVNHEDSAAVILRPGQLYRQTTVYQMGLQGIA